MIYRRTGSQYRLHMIGVIWSWRRAPDTKRAAVFCIQIAAVSSECQLFSPTKRSSSPTDSV